MRSSCDNVYHKLTHHSNVGEGVSVYVVALVLKCLLVCLTILCMPYSVVK